MNTIESTNKYTESITRSINNTLTTTEINGTKKLQGKYQYDLGDKLL